MRRACPVTALLVAAAMSAFTGAADSPVDPGRPLSPEEGLKSVRVKEGFRVELVAAEPLVADPVAIAWGPDGKLWVVEMADYPDGADGDPSPPNGSRIRFLEDADGDGKYDKSTLFMTGVNFPNGILPWRKGVLVTAAPDVFYAEDTDGDGRADKTQVLYTGFTQGNPQLRINGLRWGLDNWVYLANGWSSRGWVKSEKTGAEVEVSGRDLRIRPDTGEIETVEGMTEFGRERDDYGDWFGCDNSHPLWHFVVPERYSKRNPSVPPPDPREQLLTPFPPRVYAASKPARRYNAFDIQHHFQSACSAMVYRDVLLNLDGPSRPAPDRHAFVCDPVHNLVHHAHLFNDGVTFYAERAPDEKDREFFASTDNWCRPVMALTGPDGALWVVDMYRFMIEHPEYLPPIGKEELKPHYRLGDDRGRIYRVVPSGPRDNRPRPTGGLADLPTPELVNRLETHNGWQRDMVQMLLLWRRDPAATAFLERIVAESEWPTARLQALCTLEGLGSLPPEAVAAGLADPHWAVRRQSLRLAERFGTSPQVLEAALKLVDDPEPKVRLQLAFSLGEWQGESAARALAALAEQANDPYLAAAVLSSASEHLDAIDHVLVSSDGPEGGSPLFGGLLRMAMAKKDDLRTWSLLVNVLKRGQPPGFDAGQMRTVAGWLEALTTRGDSFEQFTARLDPELAGDLRRLFRRLFDQARSVASDANALSDTRTAAIELLARRAETMDDDLRRLSGLLTPQNPVELQRAAVVAVGRAGPTRAPAVLLKNWPTYSPELRGAVADVLLRNDASAVAFLDAVEAQQITPADIDLPRRQRLLNHKDKSIKDRAAALLGRASAVAENRQKVLDAHRPVLSMKGDGKRGAEMFRQHCAVCHHLNGQGQEVGPNLEAIREWTTEAMLTAVLDPNRQAEPKYLAYTATTTSGESIFGVIANETGGSVTMKGLDGKERPVARNDLKSLTSTNRSLMPDGFESAMTKQQLADLMEFLKAPERAQ